MFCNVCCFGILTQVNMPVSSPTLEPRALVVKLRLDIVDLPFSSTKNRYDAKLLMIF